MESTLRRFNTRAFVALVMAVSGLGLPITGVVNHIYGFSELTVARHAWMSAHNILGTLFVAFSIWHVALNGRALLGYLKGAISRAPSFRREAALACIIVAVALLFVGHAFHIHG